MTILLTLFIAYLLYLMYTTNHDLDGYQQIKGWLHPSIDMVFQEFVQIKRSFWIWEAREFGLCGQSPHGVALPWQIDSLPPCACPMQFDLPLSLSRQCSLIMSRRNLWRGIMFADSVTRSNRVGACHQIGVHRMGRDQSHRMGRDCGNVRHERIGARLAEIGLCYLVRDWRDFTACCKKGSFAIYSETTPKIIALGCHW